MTVLTLRAGHVVAGRYLLQEPIGRGGMGVVWQAWDETLRRTVAVKCARPDDEQAARRLKKEAQYAARLHHPNIVPVFDFVEEEGPDGSAGGEATCWIVMEYVPARSLAQIVADCGPLSPEDAGSVGGQIAAALVKSHSMGVVHGDVTPENVLVTEDGVARLTDFGIARALWSDVTQTHTITTGVVRGKPKYLAPELAKGRPADEKADVFSLGASLFAAVEGQSPYGEAEHPMAYVARAVEGHLEPAERAGLLTAPLAALLELDSRRRPDAVEAHRLLTRAAPPPPQLRGKLPDSPAQHLASLTLRLPRAVRRRRRPLAITAGALVAAAAVTAGINGLTAGGDAGEEDRASDAKPTATAPAGALGDVGTADPCELLDAASLSRFGDTELDPDYGELDRCDVLLVNGDGDEFAGVEVNFLSEARQFDGSVPVRRVGTIEVASMTRAGDDCERYIATSDHRGIVVIGKRQKAAAPDPCALADAATDHAVTVLDRGPVPRRPASWPAATSLARLDACALLDTAALKRVPDLRTQPSDPGFADWTCEWASPDGDTSFVRLAFNRDNRLEDDGRPTRIAGRTAYVAPDDEGDHSCAVYAPHRTYTNSVGDPTIELVRVTVHGQRATEKECATAEALTADALKNIAEQLPEGT
ncbi:Serine/threonine protein kinase [Streptomyces sp. cf386]|uniref:serine/threonine-protein kinase n=1 Tax=Streptomyces sp. cf386 TaxID=1761904 RepID=UPI0008890AB5|nr:serine/threonine-protein kinase [Streptomyces sp. cf386]SDN11187.1 Serine/threonine protein kinase [Streptomyces sp. cf386]